MASRLSVGIGVYRLQATVFSIRSRISRSLRPLLESSLPVLERVADEFLDDIGGRIENVPGNLFLNPSENCLKTALAFDRLRDLREFRSES
jgi:hypothetical protein